VNGASGDTQDVVVSCGSGQKAVGGGYSSTGDVFNLDTRPTASDDGWAIIVVNVDNTPSSGTAYATCLGGGRRGLSLRRRPGGRQVRRRPGGQVLQCNTRSAIA
jgi:hypothetical protein